MNEEIFLKIHNWVNFEPWEGAKSCWRVHGSSLKCCLAQGSRQPSRMSETYHSEFNFTPVRTKRSGNLSVVVTAAHTITDCRFWHLVTILPSVVNEDAQILSFFWLTACWMLNFFLSVKTKLGSVPSAMSCKVSCVFWPSWPHDDLRVLVDAAS